MFCLRAATAFSARAVGLRNCVVLVFFAASSSTSARPAGAVLQASLSWPRVHGRRDLPPQHHRDRDLDLRGHGGHLSHFVRKPLTVQYPDRIPVPCRTRCRLRYRGILEVDLEICTGCLACERACPIDCIVIGIDRNKETKQRLLTRFDIDVASACTAASAASRARRAPSTTRRSSRAPTTRSRAWCEAREGPGRRLQAEEGRRNRAPVG